ncbi:hypothetical protein [Phycicoccus sp. DTK01]|uniref:hypothetical protein n=1 Tax=Phycicoccus sp. DTK01 TaxID=2785745 RepID=UPI001A8F1718|nr:hypothetical protein [Phycicoccus sp. DTK01]GIL36992.1 hypothetical protein PDTK01_30670 [Phycicoccus sp. DTK01]
MEITTTTLTRAAGLAAMAAGTLFIAVQVKHPEITVDFIQSTQWKVRQGMKIAMAALALAGIAGMYLRQVRQSGVLGLLGWLLFSLGYLAMLCVEAIGLVVIPTITQSSSEYVNGVVALATNRGSSADLGLFGALNGVQGLGYIVGGLVFGVALYRSGVLARWAAALLAVAALATLAPLFLPVANQRLFALPNAIALIGLGWSLWREQRAAAVPPATTVDAPLDPAGAR